MLDEINQAISVYRSKWQKLVGSRSDGRFFRKLRPTSVAWKTEDLADFDKKFSQLRGSCEQIHVKWLNARWIATMHLKSAKLDWDIEIIKLMQRRPGSTDAVGLDHLDFINDAKTDMKKVLTAEPKLKWSEETNNPHCSWLSIWFDGTEAKLRDGTVVDVCIDELEEVRKHLAKQA